MRRRLSMVSGVLGLALSAAAGGAAASEMGAADASSPSVGADPARIEAFLEASGVTEGLGVVLAALRQHPEQQLSADQLASLSPDTREKFLAMFSDAVQQAFRLEVALPGAVASVQSDFDAKRFDAVQQQLATPLLQRVTRAERESLKSLAADPSNFSAFLTRLQRQPPTAQRLALIGREVEAMEAADPTRQRPAIVDSLDALPGALEQAQQLTVTAPSTGSFAYLSQVSPTLSSLYTYRDLSDAEMERYLQFLESDAGRWYARAGHQAIIAAIQRASQELQTHLTDFEALQQAPAQP